MNGPVMTSAHGVGGIAPGRLVAATAVLVMVCAGGAEAASRTVADTPRAPGVEAPDAAPATLTNAGFPTVRHGHPRGTMLAV